MRILLRCLIAAIAPLVLPLSLARPALAGKAKTAPRGTALAVARKERQGTVRNAAKTGGGALVDGSRTVGRTTRALFQGGRGSAKSTWKANAKTTKENAKAGGRATRGAAKSR